MRLTVWFPQPSQYPTSWIVLYNWMNEWIKTTLLSMDVTTGHWVIDWVSYYSPLKSLTQSGVCNKTNGNITGAPDASKDRNDLSERFCFYNHYYTPKRRQPVSNRSHHWYLIGFSSYFRKRYQKISFPGTIWFSYIGFIWQNIKYTLYAIGVLARWYFASALITYP